MTRILIVMALIVVLLPMTLIGDGRRSPLRVCADPNNLPFTNQRGEGFENRIAELLARDLHTHVEYTWWAQRRGFLRNTLNARRCDVVMGLPSGIDAVRTTRPYYRSTYVFVTRRDRHLDIRSFDDPRLKTLRIGVPMVADDGANAPPAHALARRGIVGNVVNYSVYGDYRQESPPSRLIAAVARGDVDIAAAWGPLAGFFASRQTVPLDVVPLDVVPVARVAPAAPALDAARLPLAFDIAMATRRGDDARVKMLDAFIARRRAEIDRILSDFHVPRIDARATQEAF